MDERYQKQVGKAVCHHVAQPSDRRHNSTGAERHGVPSKPIGDVTHSWPGENADRSGGSEDDPDLLGAQPLLAKQRWQERRLRTERRIEQPVYGQERRQDGRHPAHNAQAMMRRTAA